ncbi:MAG: bifunctional chorismate mutase/prephenate dehydrogenase [Planctomycetes bacterium TMED75]|nr:bifunctional chorismate mutase/prephenate dehydrogenase [Planctomycetaceae bacterium]OUU94896.1 MAG: bifunctional chorismate mutase/prephenate dehydrogenase [Planctomycetes bacterium TMED75]
MKRQESLLSKTPDHISTPPLPQELLDLRKQIDRLDSQLLEVLAQRNHVVSRVAGVKKKHQIPIRDRERETSILQDRKSTCQTLGLSDSVVENVYRVLLTASRERQADLGTEVPDNLSQRTVAVIGGHGGMGKLFANLFESVGQEVLLADLDTTLTPTEAASRADAVLISVPMRATVEVIRKIGPSCRKDGLLFDVTSTKVEPVEEMIQNSCCDVIGTHPMFGPSVNTLQEQRVVLVHGRLRENSPWPNWLSRCLKARGMLILESDAEEHDRSMGIVQVLTHLSTQVLGLAMARLGVPITQTMRFASPVYLMGLIMTARHFCQSSELYGAIHMSNPNQPEVARAFSQSLTDWLESVKNKDQEEFDRLFTEAHNFFGDFSDQALTQSTHLIDRLVERG